MGGKVTRKPQASAVHQALASAAAHFDAERYQPALGIIDKILAEAPAEPNALHLKGLIALRMGNPAEAERLIGLAVAGAPPNANLIVNLGNARRLQGRLNEALAAYAEAEKINADLPAIHFNRGLALDQAGDFEGAIKAHQRFLLLRPGDRPGRIRLIRSLLAQGWFRAALIEAQAGLKQARRDAVMLTLAAEASERLSELAPAVQYAAEALLIAPEHVPALKLWAAASRRLGKFEDVRARLESLPFERLNPGEARMLHAELALTLDRLGDVDGAYRQFVAQNAIAAEEARVRGIDRRAYLAQVEALATGLAPDRLKNFSYLAPLVIEAGHRAPPVFLVGFPRSGTTLLDQILDAHPDVQVFEERPSLLVVRDAVAAMKGGYPDALARLDEQARADLRARYFAALKADGAKPDQKIVINKLPLNIIHAGLIARVFPEARFILALRHPADAVLSAFMQDFQINASMANFLTLADTAHLYDRVMSLWQLARASLPLSVQPVRYEGLVADLRAEVAPVLQFLGLEWDEAMRDPAAHAKARGNIRTPSYAQVTEPIYARATQRWRRYKKYLAPVLPVLAPHVSLFGYDVQIPDGKAES